MSRPRSIKIFLALVSLIPSLVSGERGFSEDKNCTDIFHNLTHPNKCCSMPMLYVKNTSMEHCLKDCDGSDDEKCCILSCGMKTYKVMDDANKFHKENLLKYFDESLEIFEDQHKKDKWKTTTKENTEKCIKIVTNSTELHCGIPAYATWMIECIIHHNFLNCHGYTADSDDCKKTMDFMKNNVTHCSTKHDGHVIPYQDYYY